MNKKIIHDPFIGEIELTKVGETSRHLQGESIVDTIYSDKRGNFWVDTWTTFGSEPKPMMFLRKELVDKLIEISSNEQN